MIRHFMKTVLRYKVLAVFFLMYVACGAISTEAVVEMNLNASMGSRKTTDFSLYMSQSYYEWQTDVLEDGTIYRHRKEIHTPQEEALGKDEVFLRLNLTEPAHVFNAVRAAKGMKTMVSMDVLKSDKHTVVSHVRNYVGGGWNPTIFQNILPAGTYYLHFYDLYDYDCVGMIDINLDTELRAAGPNDDAVSANNSKATATPVAVGQELSGYVDGAGVDQDDWYKLSVGSVGATLEVSSSADVELLKSDGTKLAEQDDVSGTPYALAAGTYYLHFSSHFYSYEIDDGERDFLRTDGGSYDIRLTSAVNGLSINKTSLSLKEGFNGYLEVTFLPDNDAYGVIDWKSSNEDVAVLFDPDSHSKQSHVVAVNPGTATITGTLAGTNLSVKCTVTVTENAPWNPDTPITPTPIKQPDPVQNNYYVKLTDANVTLYPGEDTYLSYKYRGPGIVTFKSGNKNVVVTDGWYIKAKNPGKATITATLKGYPTVKATCKVTVKKPKIGLDKKKMTLYVGEDWNLYHAYTGPLKVVFKSGNKKVLTAIDGHIKTKKPGTSVVTAYLKGYPKIKATCKVTVRKPAIFLEKKTITLKEGSSYWIDATTRPSLTKTPKFTYKSSNKKVATVSKSGLIRAIKKGKCTITVTAKIKGYKTTAKLTVKVK